MRNSGRGGHRVRPAGGAGARQRLAVLAAFLGLTAWATAGSIVVQNDPVDGSYGTCILVNNGTGAAYPVNSGSVVIPYTLPATFTLTATAGIGREFVQWKGTAVNAGIVGAPASANTSMTPLVDTTYTLVCDFRPKRTLSMFSDGNHITMSPAAGTTTTYDKGAVVPIQTAPQLNYAFRFWGAKDNATPHPAVTNPLAEASSVVLEYSQEVRAYFSPVFSLRMFEAGGPGTASVTYSNLAANSIYTAEVPQPIIQDTTRHRYQVRGWINGNGDIPSTGTGPQYGPYNVSQSSQMRWQWDDQWRLLITASGGGTTSPGAETNYWYDNGETVTLVATPDEGYVFLGWFQGGTAIGAGTLGLLMTNSYDLTAVFVQEGDGDLDNDGMSDVWEVNFGLDPSDASGINGASGDPDADGLLNIQEFLLQQTNGLAPFQYASPINADTDGDGMDDYYERFQVDQETVDADPQFVPAALHPGGGELGLQKGPGGNPDGDAIWNTTDGYENTNNWLRNIQEWTGPDGIVPLTYENVAPGATASDGWNNPLSVTVRRAIDNPSDTGDQSSANAKDSDGDSFDDGFEYTWDLWQQANDTNEEVFVFGVRGDSITNAVPDWATDRRFNPAVLHVDAAGVDGAPDYDVLYDYETGGVSASWYSDALEYGASEANAFSADIAGAPKSIVRSLHPTWRRCSHPFYIDVDQDGLPDGYEVIFGTDPWAPVSPGTTDVDADKNPDADFMAFDSVTTNVHDEVYQANGYDPRVAWGALWPKPNEMPGEGLQPSPTTRPFSNLDEARGADGRLELMPRGSGTNITEDATSPVNEDSDADGMWDGWELYVGLDPNSDADAAEDVDDDGLDALAEFQSFVTSSMDRDQLTPLAAWMNKVFPTDPNAVDTDGDGLSDGREQGNDNAPAAQYTATVIVSGAGVVEYVDTLVAGGGWTGRCYAGGGLNPCSADTENDGLPDSWEATYSVMHGTISDQWADPDHDRLRNYEEYRVGATYHWQWDAWLPGQPVYRASDFFQGEPKAWDWYSYFDWDRTTPTQPYVYIPFLSGPDGISP